jgi:predicted nucleotidyltransferase
VEMESVQAVVQALNDADVRYLIVGGLAVVAHGYLRLTRDIDLILDLREANVRPALAALAAIGYRPLVPVPIEQFADAATRAKWIKEKGLTVFSLHSPLHATAAVDLFVEEPLDFDKAYAAAVRVEMFPGLPAPVVSYDDLIVLKRQAGRDKDLLDLKYLQSVREKKADG